MTATDALDILRHAVGLNNQADLDWVFIDAAAGPGAQSRDAVSYVEGLDLDNIRADMQVGLTGILLGDLI